jgi:hypothetical protein
MASWQGGLVAAAGPPAEADQRPAVGCRETRRDIKLSVLSAGEFAIATAGLMTLHRLGLTRLYGPPPGRPSPSIPLEVAVQALCLVLLVVLVPLHPGTPLAVLSTRTLSVIGPAHPSLHHRCQRIHYGLYVTL